MVGNGTEDGIKMIDCVSFVLGVGVFRVVHDRPSPWHPARRAVDRRRWT